MKINVVYDEGENWDFIFVDDGEKKVMAVF